MRRCSYSFFTSEPTVHTIELSMKERSTVVGMATQCGLRLWGGGGGGGLYLYEDVRGLDRVWRQAVALPNHNIREFHWHDPSNAIQAPILLADPDR